MADALANLSMVGKLATTEAFSAENFDQLVSLNQRRIYRLLISLLRDPDAADTLTQECFLKAYTSRSSFRGECSVETWLYRIAVNLARDHVRNRRVAFWKRLFASQQSHVRRPGRRGAAHPGQAPLARAQSARERGSRPRLENGAATVSHAARSLSPAFCAGHELGRDFPDSGSAVGNRESASLACLEYRTGKSEGAPQWTAT